MYKIIILACAAIMILLLLIILFNMVPAVAEQTSVEPVMAEDEITIETEDIEDSKEIAKDADYYRYLVGTTAIIYDVDPILAVSISRLETGNWESRLFKEDWNFGGITGIDGKLNSYSSEEEGVIAFIECLEWYRYKLRLDTVDSMAKKYCPPNWEQWSKSVKQIMKEETDYGMW